MKTIIYALLILVVILLYLPWYKKHQAEKQKNFFEKVKKDDIIIFTTNLFSRESFLADEEIKDTFINGEYVVQIILHGNNTDLILNCYYSGKYEIVCQGKAVDIDELSSQCLQEGLKQLNVSVA